MPLFDYVEEVKRSKELAPVRRELALEPPGHCRKKFTPTRITPFIETTEKQLLPSRICYQSSAGAGCSHLQHNSIDVRLFFQVHALEDEMKGTSVALFAMLRRNTHLFQTFAGRPFRECVIQSPASSLHESGADVELSYQDSRRGS